MKVLIWDKNIQLKNTGGPSGYLYNLHEYLSCHPTPQIVFYSDVKKIDGETQNNSTAKGVRKLLMKSKILRFLMETYHLFFKKRPLAEEDKAIINGYDFIHIHSINDIMSSFYCKGINPKIILTTHTPEPFFDEIVSRYGYTRLFANLKVFRYFLIKRECKAYKNADYIMLPVKNAEEVYTNNSSLLNETFNEIREKFFYVPTSLYPIESVGNNLHILDKYNIPSDAIILCYIGRHNKVKGYESLQKIAKRLWEKEPKIYFVIGGKEEPIKGLCDSRWIELGWVNTPDLLQEIDAFILPNQQTYFDIILLEALREGKISLLSSTGGNKWFKQHHVKGIWIYEYDQWEEVLKLCNEIRIIKENGSINEIETNIKNFYCDYFSPEHFVNNYIDILEKIQ